MRTARLASFAAIACAALAFIACGDPTASDALYDDAAVTLDVAASAGDAAAHMIETMSANEIAAGGSPDFAGEPTVLGGNLSVSRTRACYDAAGAPVSNCLPFSSVRMIATSATISGTRSNTRTTAGGGTVTWTGVVHRSSTDTTRRIFTGTTETSRVHKDVAVSHDTTTSTDGAFTRLMAESAHDSVKNVTFNLPRSSNPYPVSGSIVRLDSVHVAVSKEGKSVARDVVRLVEIIFPADAQGNVVLKVNAKTCQLNLVTHAVTNCQ